MAKCCTALLWRVLRENVVDVGFFAAAAAAAIYCCYVYVPASRLWISSLFDKCVYCYHSLYRGVRFTCRLVVHIAHPVRWWDQSKMYNKSMSGGNCGTSFFLSIGMRMNESHCYRIDLTMCFIVLCIVRPGSCVRLHWMRVHNKSQQKDGKEGKNTVRLLILIPLSSNDRCCIQKRQIDTFN